MTVTYGLYLSTNTSVNSLKPVNKSNLNNVRWSINWSEIFGNKEGECHVRIKLISVCGNINWTDNVGSVRASFTSNHQNSTNGFNLGCVIPVLDTSSISILNTYLDCDTRNTIGASMIIPKANTDFSITLLNANETAMSNVPEYQVWLYFDTEK
jgi:hypothetical protein